MMLDLEANPDLVFEYRLALRLKMTVAELRDRMPMDEFIRWGVFLAREDQIEHIETAKAKARG